MSDKALMDWPMAPCERCGRQSRLVGEGGGGDCIRCMMSFKGKDHFDLNEMHQPLDYAEHS